MPLRAEWSDEAMDDLSHLTSAQADRVVSAVEFMAETGFDALGKQTRKAQYRYLVAPPSYVYYEPSARGIIVVAAVDGRSGEGTP